MDPSLLALAAVEIISNLKEKLAKTHNCVVELEQQSQAEGTVHSGAD